MSADELYADRVSVRTVRRGGLGIDALDVPRSTVPDEDAADTILEGCVCLQAARPQHRILSRLYRVLSPVRHELEELSKIDSS